VTFAEYGGSAAGTAVGDEEAAADGDGAAAGSAHAAGVSGDRSQPASAVAVAARPAPRTVRRERVTATMMTRPVPG
jgi:hypothetical protein